MVRPFPVHHDDVVQNFCSLPLALGMFVSSIVIGLCAGHSKQYYLRKYSRRNTSSTDSKVATPSSLLLLREKIIMSTGDKADYRNSGEKSEDHHQRMIISNPNERFGEGGLWQKSILMGERCQPPQFPGVLFYDSCGNRISELPRSPRALIVENYSSLSTEAREGL